MVCVALAWLSVASVAHAASQRTFVRSDGADVGSCSLAAPCRSFNYAIGQTNPGGEVIILDTAGYGTIVINKSIKVIGPAGVYGGISVLGGVNPTTGIVINAGDTDDITLRGLDVNGVAGAPPLPLIGIDIQNAGAVHIEKSSVGNFPEDGGVCIKLTTAKTVRLYVVDSFLRHCLTGVYANGSVVSASRSGVFIDNTRIERGFNANPLSASTGVWMQGFIALSLRNSMISRHTTAVQFDSGLANANNTLDIVNSELTQNTSGLLYSATANNGAGQIRISGSQITSTTNDAISLANSAVGRNTILTIGDSFIGVAARGVVLTNTSADTANARLMVDMDNTRVLNAGSVAIDVSSTPSGAKTRAIVRDSTLAHGPTIVKTRGPSAVNVSLIRSDVHNCSTVVDHGSGIVRLQSNHLAICDNDFVNSGSGNIVSDGQSVVDGIPNASGLVYITPTPVTLK
jgi:hypothetical protein